MARSYKFKVHGNTYDVKVLRRNEEGARLSVNGNEYNVEFLPDEGQISKTPTLSRPVAIPDASKTETLTTAPDAEIGPGVVKAPLPGSIFKLLVREGDRVKPGQTVLIMEAMKMENEIRCASGGIVKSVRVKEGDSVLEGALLMQIQAT
jgi:glutaconyl-CoA/methylmalonyl-CoA decarboxylase subunit gamma